MHLIAIHIIQLAATVDTFALCVSVCEKANFNQASKKEERKNEWPEKKEKSEDI